MFKKIVLVVVVVFVVALTIFSAMSLGNRSKEITADFVSGTEYNVGEDGQVIVEVRDRNGNQVQSNCTIKIWYPDKSLFLTDVGVLSSAGNSYINFTAPNVSGIYEYQANCTAFGRYAVISKSFHVSPFQNETLSKLRRIRAEVTT
jgi:hypothetical protein